ncbi:MAG: 3'(2'),5'-bisphosphate nucleotidase [Flavobacteriaceae bacterium]|nr:3'(2'),5'-bisphosphate nucleotidase [Flavobacteriaceae bacterium]
MEDLTLIAMEAAVAAGEKIMEIYASDFSVEHKADDSPLTAADKCANETIMGYLKETGIPIISEENKEIAYAERKDWTRCWIVDPLDGTKEFVKKNGEFTVNIALVENQVPILGVIYIPVTQQLYFTEGVAGKAFSVSMAQCHSLEQASQNAVTIKPASILDTPIKIVGSRSHLNNATKNFIAAIENDQPTEIVSIGSSLKFCLVAEGKAHIYPRYAPTMEWDTAAGDAICRAVGLSVIDQQTQQPLRYNKENLLNPHFVVSV